jgi:hypothetical protein
MAIFFGLLSAGFGMLVHHGHGVPRRAPFLSLSMLDLGVWRSSTRARGMTQLAGEALRRVTEHLLVETHES